MNQLSWIEEQVEIQARPQLPETVQTENSSDAAQKKTFGEVRVLSLYALDSKGRKFTNCTAVRPNYELRGETFAHVSEGYDNHGKDGKYNLIKNYVHDGKNEDLIKLRQRFDE